MGLMDALRNRFPADKDDEEDDVEVNDEDANGLTTIGRAAYNVLSKQHGKHHSTLWNVTSGRIIGELDLSPKGCFGRTEDPPDGHSDWLPEKMGAMLKLTKTWADVMSLSPPDGKFLDELRDAITHINRNADGNNPPVIRLMFGNIIGKLSLLLIMVAVCFNVLFTLSTLITTTPKIHSTVLCRYAR
jgi:hypothetical protein